METNLKQSLSDEYDKFIAKREERPPRRIDEFYPHEIGSCARKTYFSITVNREYPVETLKKFKIGDICHEHLAKFQKEYLASKGYTVRDEKDFIMFINNIRISGRADVLAYHKDGSRIVIENKSAKSIIPNIKANKPSESHVSQIMPYLRMFDAKGIICYIDKTTGQIAMFDVDYCEDIFKRDVAKLEELHKFLVEKKMPPAKPSFSYECDYCIYGDICSNELQKEVK